MKINFSSKNLNIILTIIISSIFIGATNFLNLNNIFYDFLSKITLKNFSPSKEIVIVTIDENAINKYGDSSNWTIARYNNLVKIIESQKPKALLLDYYFNSKTIPESVDWELINKISLEKLEKTEDIFKKYQKNITSDNYLSSIDKDFSNSIKKYQNLYFPILINDYSGEIETKPITLFTRGSTLGYTNVKKDSDGVIRKFYDSEKYNHIGKVIIQNINSNSKINTKNKLIRYYSDGENRIYNEIPYINLYKKKFEDYNGNKINLEDKIVVVGDYGAIFGDYHKTPVGFLPGMEILANQIQNFADNSFIYNFNFIQNLSIFIITLAIFFLIFNLIKDIYFGIIILASSLLITYFLSYFCFIKGIFINFNILSIGILSPYFGINLSRFWLNYEEKMKLKKFFSRFVGKNLVEQLINNNTINLAGEKRKMTIFFADIEGFTTLSEKLTPEEIINILNKMFEVGNRIIFKNYGTLDKYIGDAIMAFWGAPLSDEKHEINACISALEIKKGLSDFNQKLENEGLPKISIRIGISSGIVTVGSVGTDEYSDYTVIGDNVNLASRLESINRAYNTDILISEYVLHGLGIDFIYREIDEIKVKGKNNSVKIYELLDNINIGIHKKKYLDEIINNHRRGLENYRKQKWTEAKKYFENNLSLGDEVAKIFINRINNFSINKPRKDWDGVWKFDEK